jgi:hypothetical protein
VSRAARTAVVHLVREANGVAPFEAFLDSYRRHEAAAEHDLVLLFKGFPDERTAAPYLERAGGAATSSIHVSDTGFDLRAYLDAARTLPHRRVCFVNSFSRVLAPRWLAVLDGALDDAGVGAAGATGSWGSHLSYGRWQLGLDDPYARAFDSRPAVRRTMHEISGVNFEGGELRHWLLCLVNFMRDAPSMPLFPSVHLRTNAFLMDRETFCGLRWGPLRTKRSTYRMESGRRSLTAQLRARGLRCVVVDRAGVARDAPDWHEAAVFWQEDQRDLLVADNQTRTYAEGPPEWRRVLSAYAWGDRARPV